MNFNDCRDDKYACNGTIESTMYALYQQIIMDHYKNPRFKGAIENPDIDSGVYNPSCGDKTSFTARVSDEVITDIAWDGIGCVISLATASLLAELAINKQLNEVLMLDKNDILIMIGIELGPTRLKCALLPLEAIKKGIQEYRSTSCLIEQK